MPSWLQNLDWLNPWAAARDPEPEQAARSFSERYASFEDLLRSNSELSKIVADLELKLQGRQIFGVRYVRAQSSRAVHHTRRMVECLDDLDGRAKASLGPIVDRLEEQILDEIGRKSESLAQAYVLPLSEVTREVVDWVGSKNANLGEARNRVGAPVPDGFAVTTTTFVRFLTDSGLMERIRERAHDLTEADDSALEGVAAEIRELVLGARVPADVAEPLLHAYDHLTGGDPTVLVAVRSSAVGEDTELTHGGQYLTVLGVRRDGLVHAYQRVVASLYSPWALSYRLHAGVHDEDLAMGVVVVPMIRARTSGVMYSRAPDAARAGHTLISAVFGLGTSAVDGTFTPDHYVVAPGPERAIVERRIAHKPFRVVVAEDGGTTQVPLEDGSVPCLTDDELRALAALAERLEAHFGTPQDIEWATDEAGQLHVLQTRPLIVERRPVRKVAPRTHHDDDVPVLLLDGGAVACPGVGTGPVFHVREHSDLKRFPEGAVLVAKHPSPRFARALRQAAAIVTDTGSVLGHMASLCREFGVPALVDTRVATERLVEGALVTVDASTARVFAGTVPGVAAEHEPYMADTPVRALLDRVAERIVPLRLTDPRSPEFTAASCRSLHDVMRFVHERCYKEMFRTGDVVAGVPGGTVQLDAALGIDLHVIDLGGGLSPRHGPRIRPPDVLSVPLRAVLAGMLHPELVRRGGRVVSMRGLASVITEQMFRTPHAAGERFGDRSYAVVSDRYLHFSSRVGYHYSLLDAWYDEEGNKSHIGFSFQGGAAGELRRVRRVKAISLILTELGFAVDVRGDRVDARLKRGSLDELVEQLDQIGRLLQFTRQLDMLMDDDAVVDKVADAFLAERYDLSRLSTSR